ncbi:MAG: beta-N-acetylglucosaminidase domain-containing protein [Desulfobacterales bacterium]
MVKDIPVVYRINHAATVVLSAALLLCACSGVKHSQPADVVIPRRDPVPLHLSYAVRLAQFEMGNLAANPSFEENEPAGAGIGTAAGLAHWMTAGSGVERVDIGSGRYAPDEVAAGRQAVKIVKRRAGELDAAQGIISDFIPVIPGNYDFTYDVKLKDIAGSKARLGSRLGDAVVVKTFFFDAQKKMLDPADLNPVTGSTIDNSDKSYSFSNFWRIDDFGWATVHGRTYNYPFSEGDLPEGTCFVQLFFGLKGRGTLWVDNVVYRYSKWNFSALERMQPYFDRQLSAAEKIIPTPKSLEPLGDIVYFDPRSPGSRPPMIIIPQEPAAAELTAARILQQKMNAGLRRGMPAGNRSDGPVRILARDVSLEEVRSCRLVFSIGRSDLYRKMRPDLPWHMVGEKSQGYIITSQPVGRALVVFLLGETPAGTFNATATAVQLLEEEKCVYHDARVADFPDFLGRSYCLKNWRSAAELHDDIAAIDRMSLFKLNKVYGGHNRSPADWYLIDDLFREGVAAAGRKCRDNGTVSLALMVNPYSHLGFESSVAELDEQRRNLWSHGRPESIDLLKDFFKVGLDAGAGTIMLQADDSVPHTGKNKKNYALYTAEDRHRFLNLQTAQAHVINTLKQWVDSTYPGTRFEFCPPWYANEFIDRSEGRAEVYFGELTARIPRDIAIVWTGPTVRSLSVDTADLHRYGALIGRWPMMWDNTLYARNLDAKSYGGYTTHYPDKVRMCNLFEPFDTYRPEGFQRYNDGRHMYTNANAYSEVYKIKLATVADYEWNTAAYDPERSLWKVLCGLYGMECARALVLFNDAYYGLFEACLRMEAGGATAAFIESGRIFLTEMDRRIEEISRLIPAAHPLLEELADLRARQDKRFAEFSRSAAG